MPRQNQKTSLYTSKVVVRTYGHTIDTQDRSITLPGPIKHELVSTAVILIGWRRGVVVSGVRRMNEANARRARLVPGWVTVFGWVYHLGM